MEARKVKKAACAEREGRASWFDSKQPDQFFFSLAAAVWMDTLAYIGRGTSPNGKALGVAPAEDATRFRPAGASLVSAMRRRSALRRMGY